jgi:hypothetical protein
MTKVDYGYLKVTVKAEEDEINGPNELALSDVFAAFSEDLEQWLEERETDYPEFALSVRDV